MNKHNHYWICYKCMKYCKSMENMQNFLCSKHKVYKHRKPPKNLSEMTWIDTDTGKPKLENGKVFAQ